MSWSKLESQALKLLNTVRVTPYHPAERHILFEFEVESVLVTEYKGDETIRTRWKVDE